MTDAEKVLADTQAFLSGDRMPPLCRAKIEELCVAVENLMVEANSLDSERRWAHENADMWKGEARRLNYRLTERSEELRRERQRRSDFAQAVENQMTKVIELTRKIGELENRNRELLSDVAALQEYRERFT